MDIMGAKLGASRRSHSPELKAIVIEECRQPGASVAAIAMARGLNANLVHQWLRASKSQASEAVTQMASSTGFVAVKLSEPAVPKAAPPSVPTTASRDIHIELRRGASTVSVSWPVEAAAQCGAWISEWLR